MVVILRRLGLCEEQPAMLEGFGSLAGLEACEACLDDGFVGLYVREIKKNLKRGGRERESSSVSMVTMVTKPDYII